MIKRTVSKFLGNLPSRNKKISDNATHIERKRSLTDLNREDGLIVQLRLDPERNIIKIINIYSSKANNNFDKKPAVSRSSQLAYQVSSKSTYSGADTSIGFLTFTPSAQRYW